VQHPTLITIAGLSLGLLLGHGYRLTRRRRHGPPAAALRVHLALQRFRRQIHPGPDGLVDTDLTALRGSMGWRQRRQWDHAMRAYLHERQMTPTDTVEGNGYSRTDLIAARLDQLIALTAYR